MRQPRANWAFLGLAVAATIGGLTLRGQEPAARSATGPPSPIVISEVRFDPRPGDSAFVELLNTGPAPVPVSRMAIRIEGGLLPLARVTDPVPPGGRLLVWFDGLGRTEGLVHHAAQSLALDPDGGFVDLRDERDRRCDVVAWGDSDGSVDRAFDELIARGEQAGRTIGRPPGASRPSSPLDWVEYSRHEATPGSRNPMPPVRDLLPGSGEILRGPTVTLQWYPVAGAQRYRVQVARDEVFGSPLFDTTAATTTVPSPSFAAGTYFWRVQTIAADGTAGIFSSSSVFRVIGSAPAAANASGAALRIRSTSGWPSGKEETQSLFLDAPTRVLPVPYIQQHKDTEMLQLENPKERDPHGWDKDHRSYDRSDPSDSHNCVVATTAMINRFFRGDLSQDRIAYEVRSDRAAKYAGQINGHPTRAGFQSSNWPAARVVGALREARPGPEGDLIYGDGLNSAQIAAALTFALGGLPQIHRLGGQNQTAREAWDVIRKEIDAGRPILRKSMQHAVAVVGYGVYGGERILVLNDPARGQVFSDIELDPPADYAWFFITPNPQGVRQEPGVLIDTDGDGVVDFDETARFHTDPASLDTDKDGVPDKADIASGVFDARYGYAVSWDPIGRDFDRDGVPTELDPDSDSGGCHDGVEDNNRNGHLDVPEAWNFNADDDVCKSVNGHIMFSAELVGELALQTFRHEFFSVSVALKPERPGEIGPMSDNGSSFRMQTISQVELSLDGGCTVVSRGTWSGAGPFKPGTDEVGGHAGETEMAVGASAESPGSLWTDLCFIAGGDQTNDTASLPLCDGKRVSKTSRSYRFNCTTPPQAPPGYRFLSYSVTGSVTLAPPVPVGELMTTLLRNPYQPHKEPAYVPSSLALHSAGTSGRVRLVAR